LDCNSLDEFGVPASAPCRSLTRRSIHGLFTGCSALTHTVTASPAEGKVGFKTV
jgi:hypothetical protein